MNHNAHVEQYDRREFRQWLREVGRERAEALLRREGCSSSLAYKLILGTYDHRIGMLATMAIKKAMLKT